MRKTATIFITVILILNWHGYYWLSGWLQQKADIQLESRLDNNDYAESSLVEIKVPVNLPYQTDWDEFERCDGEIMLNGIHYKYVKRKVQDGMLILKCIPNQTKQKLLSARDQFFELVNDLQQNKSNKTNGYPNPVFAKKIMSDFDDKQYFGIVVGHSFFSTAYIHFASSHYYYLFNSVLEHPPQA